MKVLEDNGMLSNRKFRRRMSSVSCPKVKCECLGACAPRECRSSAPPCELSCSHTGDEVRRQLTHAAQHIHSSVAGVPLGCMMWQGRCM